MFTKKTEVDSNLETALAKADQVLTERAKIGTTIEKTLVEIDQTKAELQNALERLADEEADAALSDPTGARRDTVAQRAVLDLRMRVEAQQARLRGLSQRNVDNEDRVQAALDELTTAQAEWRDARVAEFRSELMKAVTTLAAILRKGLAIGDATGAPRLSTAMRSSVIYDPTDGTTRLFEMDPRRYDPAVRMSVPYPAWQDDSAAKALHDSLVPTRQKIETLRRLWEQIRNRREEAAREERKRQADSQYQRQSSSYEVQYAPQYSELPVVEYVQAGKNS